MSPPDSQCLTWGWYSWQIDHLTKVQNTGKGIWGGYRRTTPTPALFRPRGPAPPHGAGKAFCLTALSSPRGVPPSRRFLLPAPGTAKLPLCSQVEPVLHRRSFYRSMLFSAVTHRPRADHLRQAFHNSCNNARSLQYFGRLRQYGFPYLFPAL